MRSKKNAKVIVAMSGGVDSSVSAAFLKKAGFNVTGMFMKCWSVKDPFGEHCTSSDDERMARLAAAKIGIPFYSINLIDEYKKRVVDYMLAGYKKGITPNPDVMCNKEIKFGLFFEKAMELGADYVATGHYAIVRDGNIFAGKDPEKDQSYFLTFINAKLLPKILFPIGTFKKTRVREIAKKLGLPNADRKDSQGICFIGEVDFVEFLKAYIPTKKGNIVNTEGRTVGKHNGAWYYTIGQRKGLGLAGGPYFVLDKDVKKNVVVVTKNQEDLRKQELYMRDVNWLSQDKKHAMILID
ncbi:tRNA 2-thiouridine(34) synthase MnmA, partial [Patescibacteria group bacterium]|nr:tRNA 2-thiouridine(34) synthase MnmA [Patescibacteria group bacterium]